MNYFQPTTQFIDFLYDKGFKLNEADRKFLTFIQHYTKSEEPMINFAIWMTLKTKYQLDGSYCMALLESLNYENIKTIKEATHFFNERITNGDIK